MDKIATKIVIKEESSFQRGFGYFSTLTIKKNSISYNENSKNYVNHPDYVERNHSFKYTIESTLFENKFYELVQAIEKYIARRMDISLWSDSCENNLIIQYNDGSILKLRFSLSFYENGIDEAADIIKSMIPSCEPTPDYLIQVEEEEDL